MLNKKYTKNISIYSLAIFLLIIILQRLYLNYRSKINTKEPININLNKGNKNDISHQPQKIFINEFIIYLYKLPEIKKISLHSNIYEKLSLKDALLINNCEVIFSGGFFSNTNHIGLFKIEDKIVSPIIDSAFYNGFINILDSSIEISNTYNENSKYSFQTGPLFMHNIKIFSDLSYKEEFSRRILLANNNNGKTYLIIVIKDNLLEGPSLNQIPNILNTLNNNHSLNLNSVVNLDGGSHAGFGVYEYFLTELFTSGSYVCINPK